MRSSPKVLYRSTKACDAAGDRGSGDMLTAVVLCPTTERSIDMSSCFDSVSELKDTYERHRSHRALLVDGVTRTARSSAGAYPPSYPSEA